jgi:hypothetical protein
MALGSTQSLTKMSTMNLPGCKKRPARSGYNLAAIYVPQPLATLRASTACYRDNFNFTFTKVSESNNRINYGIS